MYEQFFGLSAPPFQINPDPSFYFESKGHGSAHQYLRFGAFQGEGFIVLTGDIGAGKTTLLRALLAELDPAKVVAAQIVSTQLEAGELLSAVALAFGIPCDGMSKAKLLVTLEAFLASLAATHRRALLIIDEAQNLGPAAIEELRMLSNFQFGSRALLQSFLVGQPELRDILRLPQMEQLRQRVIASCHLGPMDAAETRAYIEHRLRHVGWANRPAFNDEAFESVHHWSAGVPRRINMLCSRLLLAAFLENSEFIDAERVERVAAEIRDELAGTAQPSTPGGSNAPPNATTHATITDPATPPNPRLKRESVSRKPEQSSAEAPFHETLNASPPEHVSHAAYLDLQLAGDLPLTPNPPNAGPLLCVAASRAALIAISALIRAFRAREDLPSVKLVQIQGPDALTDAEIVARDAADLGLPDTGFILDLQATSRAGRLAEVMATFAGLLNAHAPSAVVVCDEVGVSVVCALTANQCRVPVVRIDAGLRHGERSDLHEINRVLLDNIASLLCVSERPALTNLQSEGIPDSLMHLTGNPSIDSMLQCLARSVDPAQTLRKFGTPPDVLAQPKGYALVWIEQAAQEQDDPTLAERNSALHRLSSTVTLVWPMRHIRGATLPRHRSRGEPAMVVLPELSYLELLGLLREAVCVLTDSGWMQDHATAIGVPCLTLAHGTERQASVQDGTNVLVGSSLRHIFQE
ncbi:MAG: XrtA-associated ATPase, partial [Betaproteobacteria bacterium]|nr:XrtA-associated ATPase [Betaproteobacteria bacterium]